MTPGNYPLALYRGDSYRWQFKLWLDAAKTQPADLADVTPKAQIRSKPAGTLLADLDCVVTLPNIIDASLDHTESQELPSKGSWDLQLTYTGGDVRTILAGPVTVTPDVTDSATP